ncbi:glycosyltransferase involved in cell wall biosynthesis [Janthinobacterium sp. 67]|uniref:glycosyltransferase family 2 protein n=1 Tax=Janthinobacterium sp. 67 TaxID=2035207 RepID=UPI000C250C91|nr:glycosyltransferase family 2 protein [Janthinobacterium sp. 67]PJJ21895.1 glycosyltransferase involved in cell wall biosynthesis [Janthinobacterium sp. 67]
MLCSVIVPLYNKEQYVQAALASVLAQTHQELEIVVVDDGSRDGGAALVEAMHDPRIRLIRQANGGVSRARNAGVAVARGELICFLDADDWYGPAYLETVCAMARQHPDGAFYATAYRRVSGVDDAAWDMPSDSVVIDNFFAHRHRHGPFFFTGSVAVPRRVLQDMQPCFPEGENFGEDQDLWFRLAENARLVYCPARLVAYRVDVAGSLTAVHNLQSLPPFFLRLEQRATSLPASDAARRPALRIVSDARVSVARFALQEGRRGAALAELWRAARCAISARWAVTVLVCSLGNASMLKRWELWRELRKCN